MHLIFLYVLFYGTSEASLVPPKNLTILQYPSCLKTLIAKFADLQYIYSINLDLGLDQPLVRLDLTKKNTRWFKLERSQLTIIYDENNLQPVLEEVSQKPMFNPRSVTVIITTKVRKSIFETASKYHISKLIVLETQSLKLYSYRPYKLEDVDNPSMNLFVWGTCLNGTLAKKLPNFDLPTKWRNTTIRVLNNMVPPYTICPTCPVDRGIEYEVFDSIADRLNFKVAYTRDGFDYWGGKSNGSYNHILGQLQRREGDMTIGVFHSKFEEHIDFDMSFTYMEDGTRWLVPQARVLPYWKRLSLIFTKEVYLSLFLSLLLMMVVCHILYNTSYSSSWVMLYQILLEYSIKRLPVTFRTTIIIWTGSCLILSTMFKSKLIDIMSKNSYGHQISTLTDIVNSKLEILIDHDIAKFYDYSTNSDEEYVKKNYRYCTNPRDCITRTAFEQDCVTVDFQRSNEFFLPSYVDSEGDVLIHLFKTYIFPVHIHLYFSKGYPIFPQIDQLLMRMRSNGVVQHLYDNAGYNARMAMNKKITFKAEVLGLEQMQIAFFIWGIGILIAVLVFTVEQMSVLGTFRRTTMVAD